MKNAQRIVAVMMAAGGFLAVGAGGAVAHDGAQAYGAAQASPGALSGNTVQVPVHIPVNVCGNTVNIIAALNPTFGNVCVNH